MCVGEYKCMYAYVYVYVCICVCVCACVLASSLRTREIVRNDSRLTSTVSVAAVLTKDKGNKMDE